MLLGWKIVIPSVGFVSFLLLACHFSLLVGPRGLRVVRATDESWTLAQRGMLTVENPVFWEGDKEGTVSGLPNHKDKERKEGGGEQMCFNLYSTII